MNRDINLKIAQHILEYAKEYPDLRFGQLLYALRIVEWEGGRAGIRDPWEEPSIRILERVESVVTDTLTDAQLDSQLGEG